MTVIVKEGFEHVQHARHLSEDEHAMAIRLKTP